MKVLTNNDLHWAAAKLGWDLAAIRAVDEVESNGKGFRSDGNIVIRFETHIFKRYTGRTIVGSGDMAFNTAYLINPRAALLSTSWGRYQIMGFNYEVCGYDSVEEFVAAMKTGERKQLEAFVAFVIGNKLSIHLRPPNLNFLGFKNGYNGTGENGYEFKLEKAYNKYKGMKLPANNDPAPLVKK
ncbi:N-acetylmuramidase family protein [Spirosoma pomorum]